MSFDNIKFTLKRLIQLSIKTNSEDYEVHENKCN